MRSPDLKEAFGALGRVVTDDAPGFDQLTSSHALDAARWRRRRRSVAPLVVVILVITLFAPLRRENPGFDYEQFTALTGIDLNSVTWVAPSDVLLDVPGRELLRSVPGIAVQRPVVEPDSVRSPDSNATRRRSRS